MEDGSGSSRESSGIVLAAKEQGWRPAQGRAGGRQS